MTPTLIGPAHVDLDHDIAHRRHDCPALLRADPTLTALAADGPMDGFTWCRVCGELPFKAAPVTT